MPWNRSTVAAMTAEEMRELSRGFRATRSADYGNRRDAALIPQLAAR